MRDEVITTGGHNAIGDVHDRSCSFDNIIVKGSDPKGRYANEIYRRDAQEAGARFGENADAAKGKHRNLFGDRLYQEDTAPIKMIANEIVNQLASPCSHVVFNGHVHMVSVDNSVRNHAIDDDREEKNCLGANPGNDLENREDSKGSLLKEETENIKFVGSNPSMKSNLSSSLGQQIIGEEQLLPRGDRENCTPDECHSKSDAKNPVHVQERSKYGLLQEDISPIKMIANDLSIHLRDQCNIFGLNSHSNVDLDANALTADLGIQVYPTEIAHTETTDSDLRHKLSRTKAGAKESSKVSTNTCISLVGSAVAVSQSCEKADLETSEKNAEDETAGFSGKSKGSTMEPNKSTKYNQERVSPGKVRSSDGSVSSSSNSKIGPKWPLDKESEHHLDATHVVDQTTYESSSSIKDEKDATNERKRSKFQLHREEVAPIKMLANDMSAQLRNSCSHNCFTVATKAEEESDIDAEEACYSCSTNDVSTEFTTSCDMYASRRKQRQQHVAWASDLSHDRNIGSSALGNNMYRSESHRVDRGKYEGETFYDCCARVVLSSDEEEWSCSDFEDEDEAKKLFHTPSRDKFAVLQRMLPKSSQQIPSVVLTRARAKIELDRAKRKKEDSTNAANNTRLRRINESAQTGHGGHGPSSNICVKTVPFPIFNAIRRRSRLGESIESITQDSSVLEHEESSISDHSQDSRFYAAKKGETSSRHQQKRRSLSGHARRKDTKWDSPPASKVHGEIQVRSTTKAEVIVPHSKKARKSARNGGDRTNHADGGGGGVGGGGFVMETRKPSGSRMKSEPTLYAHVHRSAERRKGTKVSKPKHSNDDINLDLNCRSNGCANGNGARSRSTRKKSNVAVLNAPRRSRSTNTKANRGVALSVKEERDGDTEGGERQMLSEGRLYERQVAPLPSVAIDGGSNGMLQRSHNESWKTGDESDVRLTTIPNKKGASSKGELEQKQRIPTGGERSHWETRTGLRSTQMHELAAVNNELFRQNTTSQREEAVRDSSVFPTRIMNDYKDNRTDVQLRDVKGSKRRHKSKAMDREADIPKQLYIPSGEYGKVTSNSRKHNKIKHRSPKGTEKRGRSRPESPSTLELLDILQISL